MQNENILAMDQVLPDLALMKKLKGQAFNLSDEWLDEVLPAIQGLLKDFKLQWLDAERALQASLLGFIGLFENADYSSFGDRNVDEDKIAAAVSAQAGYCKEMAALLLQMKLFSLSMIGDELERLEAEASRRGADLNAFRARLEQLNTEYADVVKAIEMFNRPSVISAFRGMIPSDDEVDAIVGLITDPKVDKEALKTITHKLTSYIETLDGARRFSELGRVRSKLERKILEAKAQVNEHKAQADQADAELKAHQCLTKLEPLKVQWLQEAYKVEREWQVRSDKLASLPGEDGVLALESLYEYTKAVYEGFLTSPD